MASNAKGTVLVTGASGFLGSHIVTLLLATGYSVRATARGAKVDALRSALEGKALEVTEVKDIANDDLTEAFKGISAVIHSATPISSRAQTQETLRETLNGTLNVLRHALGTNIEKVVLTSSWCTVLDPDLKQQYESTTFDQNSWGNVTPEDIINGTHDPRYVYLGSKTLAEKAAWNFANENSRLDLTSINPPFTYGPFIDGLGPAGPQDVGSNGFILSLISGPPGRPLPPLVSPYFIHVRDVARAHVAALGVPKVASGPLTQKRFLISGGAVSWKEVVEYISETRPELRPRLPDVNTAGFLPDNLSKNDMKPAAKSLGLGDYIGWQMTVTETIDNLLALEKKWASKL